MASFVTTCRMVPSSALAIAMYSPMWRPDGDDAVLSRLFIKYPMKSSFVNSRDNSFVVSPFKGLATRLLQAEDSGNRGAVPS